MSGFIQSHLLPGKPENNAALLIPAPVRDIVMGPTRMRNFEDQTEGFAPGTFGVGDIRQYLTDNMRSAPIRITLAALGALAVYNHGFAVGASAVLGAVVSLPSLVIVGGSWLLHQGATACIDSLASGSLINLGTGIAYGVCGWLSLEGYRMLPIGLVETFVIKPICDKNS